MVFLTSENNIKEREARARRKEEHEGLIFVYRVTGSKLHFAEALAAASFACSLIA